MEHAADILRALRDLDITGWKAVFMLTAAMGCFVYCFHCWIDYRRMTKPWPGK